MADGEQKERYPNRWKPGQSGNPKGRPRGGMGLVHAAQRMVSPEDLVTFALNRINGPEYDEKAKVWACEWLAKIGYKLPAQTVDVNRGDGDEEFDNMTDAELDAIIAEG